MEPTVIEKEVTVLGVDITAEIPMETDDPSNEISVPGGRAMYKGDTGASAYEIAVKNGFVGTEEEWLASLKGKDSDTSITAEGIETALGYKPVNKDDIPTKPSDIGAEASGTAESKVSGHNTDTASHNDIRLMLEELRTSVLAFLDVDDASKDQLSELLALIDANADSIESITNGKVSKTDIVNDLLTNVANKPLSAAQGVALKALIDALQTKVDNIKVPTKLSELTGDTTHRTVTDAEKETWNAKLDQSALQGAAEDILAQAKENGDFDGDDGERGTGVLKVFTVPSSYTTAIGDYTPQYRMALSTIKSQAKVKEVLIGDILHYSYYQYHIDYLDGSYAYISASRTSLRGADGTTPRIGENGNWFVGSTDMGVKAEGSDANVTEKNIKSALGYTPADKTAMDGLSEAVGNKADGNHTHDASDIDTSRIALKEIAGDKLEDLLYAFDSVLRDKADTSDIPTKLSQFTNDKNFATKGDLSQIPKFTIKVVTSLPLAEISPTTLYLLTSGNSVPNYYIEYIFIPDVGAPENAGLYEEVDGSWEKLGEGTIDVSGYYKKSETYSKTEIDGKGFLTDLSYGVCDTAADTAAKTVTVSDDDFELKEGAVVFVKFINANSTASPTLNVNGTGAKPIYRYGTTASSTGTSTTGWRAGAVQIFIFDGTGWIRDFWENTTYSNVSLGQGYATCSTAAATLAKTAALSSYSLTANGIVSVKFTNDVPAKATLNINSKGAKAIYFRDAPITDGVIKAGDTATFIYNSYYRLISIDRWGDAESEADSYSSETWTFTLEDGSTVVKQMVCRPYEPSEPV